MDSGELEKIQVIFLTHQKLEPALLLTHKIFVPFAPFLSHFPCLNSHYSMIVIASNLQAFLPQDLPTGSFLCLPLAL